MSNLNGETRGGLYQTEDGQILFRTDANLALAGNGGYYDNGGYDLVDYGNVPSDFTNSNWALEIGGGIYGAMEGATASQGYWLGKNGKYYHERWGGNQYTGSRAGAFKAANTYKWAGRGTVAITAVIGGIQTYNGYQMDGGQFGYNAQSAAAQTIGGIGGSMGGAVLGAEIGAGIGVWFGGVGAVPGAIIGGFAGGIIGGWGGSSLGQGAVNLYHGR